MKKLGLKAVLYINYFVFAILLNSVGIVIKQAIENYNVLETEASILEAFKDLPIAIVSFFVASFLPRMGYKRTMLYALILSLFGCVYMYFGNSFLSTKILFACIGVSFAFIKISVFSIIGLLTTTKEEHSSLMSSIEGVFMIGVAATYFIFPVFFNESNPDSWLNVYLFLAVLIAIAFVLLLFAKMDTPVTVETSKASLTDFLDMMKLIALPLVMFFILSAFLFAMVEQGIMTWLPTFNKKILSLNDVLSVQMASILAISLSVGRLLAGRLVKRIHWVKLLTYCIIIAMVLVTLVLPGALNRELTTIESIWDIPPVGFIFPIIGLFIAPIYPLINSALLSVLPTKKHSSATGLIVIFSALGGTFGSRAIGYLFEHIDGARAFYFLLIPMSFLIITLFLFNRAVIKYEASH
ncbi:MFS transporter [Ascidiimonas sp. W6]|uniref:MFS transporter n=1 Tax=Ascidiimonas meishanensis TaxID=3128903 RepID=UPI0030EEFC73